MRNESCELTPKVNGKPSRMFLELNKKLGHNRPLTKYIYACYLQLGVAELMNSLGYKVNSQGQHDAIDVYNFFDGATLENEISSASVSSVEKLIGSKDFKGNYIDYENAEEALNKALNLNSTTKGLVASVIKFGSKFRIIVLPRTSKTQYKVSEVEEQSELWQTIKQFFSNYSIDIDSLSKKESLRDTLNPLNSNYFINYLNNIKSAENKYLYKKDIEFLFNFNPNSTGVKRLIIKYGTLEDAVDTIYGYYRGNKVLTNSEINLIENTLDQCKKFKGFDIYDLLKLLSLQSKDYEQSSKEASIRDTIKELNDKYGIDVETIHLTSNNINSLYEAAAHASITILRQIDKLKNADADEEKVKQLETTLKLLTQELKGKHYYAGSLNFLNEATNQILHIQDLLLNIPTGSTVFEDTKNVSAALLEAEDLFKGYYFIVEALCDIDSIASSEDITTLDKETLEKKAKEIKEIFDNQKSVLNKLKEENLLNIAISFLGDSTANGIAVANFVLAAKADSSWFDYLYAVGRASDPLVNLMARIARDAQDSRDAKMNEVGLRIRRIHNKLRKSGIKNTDFMYEDDGHIVSPYDWKKFDKARAKHIASLKKLKVTGISLLEAIKKWELKNTEEVVVDKKNGRTERMPIDKYYKTNMDIMSSWTPALLEYYDEIMQLKGEIGSLLPVYAQHLYMPPQKRRSWIDAIKSAKNIKDVIKATKNKFLDIYKIREDDEEFAYLTTIDGESVAIASGNFDNTVLKRIPIFYISKLKDLGELLKDFGLAMSLLANTAINYDAMSLVKDTLEFIGEYAKDRDVLDKLGNMGKVERVFDSGVAVFKDLTKRSKSTNTANIIDGFLDALLYKIKFNKTNKYTKFLLSLIVYNSMKALAVNLRGAIVNHTNGIFQIFVEAGGGEFFNFTDMAWAIGRLSFDLVTGAPGKIMDFFTGNKNSIDFLLAEKFDPIPGRFTKLAHQRYSGGIFRLLWGHDFTYTLYELGEFHIHYLVMYSMLHHKKVLIDGKEDFLYNAFSKTEKEDGNSELVLKDNVTNLDGTPYTEDDNQYYRKEIRLVAQSCHGAMSEEDKGVIHLYMLGKFAMNLRQWMVEYYSKRFRTEYVDASTNLKRSGMWHDTKRWAKGNYNKVVDKLLSDYVNDVHKYQVDAVLYWETMTTTQKANVRKVFAEIGLISSLYILSFALGEPEDHKKEFWYRMWIYVTKRTILDIRSGLPIFNIGTFDTIVNSPIPAVSTVRGLLYPITGLAYGDFMEEIKSGPYKGWNKYVRNVIKYSIPWYWQVSQLYNMDEDESIFRFLDNTKN